MTEQVTTWSRNQVNRGLTKMIIAVQTTLCQDGH
jgi:hypothetical protein